MHSHLDNFAFLTGRGQDPEGKWDAEESFFIAGIQPKEAMSLARKYGQRAIVMGVIKSEAKLVETLDSTGN